MGRRSALEGIRLPRGKEPHRGLWLDKFLRSTAREDAEAKRSLVREVVGIEEPREYAAFFERYRKALVALGAELRQAKTLSRLVVGLGGESVLETSLTLHRAYGVPYIPGSALKGLASRYAHLYLEGEAWRRNLAQFQRGEAQTALFGTTEEQGLVVFFDALPLPGKWRLHPDILNPHHPLYYRGEEEPPADWDSPTPVPFLSATGTFLLALAPAPGVDREAARPWLTALWRILAWALKEEGVGAKTSSGYGRMALAEPGVPEAGRGSPALSPALEGLLTRVRSLRYPEVPRFLASQAEVILALSAEEAQALRQALEGKGFLCNPQDLKRWLKEHPGLERVWAKLGLT
ncbi:type III-B CRISPR module RAMP protein Cmr6 [Thermus sp.]|uniref:type III-B CRISPR module RAMP protein Cmr6 n=1 Tax=Thermus sp. TaxID=275 RepID=UPI003D152552